MAYQVIARKYRPQRFSDVVGQEHVTRTLAQAIERKRVAHAYLFCGPRGTGKTTIARIFAKCLNCTGGPLVDFAEDDPRCREIAEGRSLDVLEIDAASNRGIDEIRGLRDTVRYAPASSKFKIYIIDEVHMLTKEAFNALLKTLEEPPEHVKFMFATTEPEKVLTTILSRCQRFDLRRIPAPLIVKHLASIAEQENVKIEPAALNAIARGAEGAMRDAESTLDQLISFCGQTIEEADVLSMFGMTSQSQLLALAGAILEGNPQNALKELNALIANGKDLGRLLGDLLSHFRNLLIHTVSGGDSQLLEVTEAEASVLNKQAGLATAEGLTRMLEILGDAEIRLRDAASKKILFEVTLLNAIDARRAVSLDTVLRRLESLRGSGSSGGEGSGTARAPQPGPIKTAQSKPAAQASYERLESVLQEQPTARPLAPVVSPTVETPPEVQPALADSGELWAKLLESVGRASPFTRTYLLEAHLVSWQRGLMVIGFPAEFEDHIGLVDNARNHVLLQTKLAELGYPHAQFKFIKSERPRTQEQVAKAAPEAPKPVPTATPKAPPPPQARQSAPQQSAKDKPASIPFNKDEFKNDPLIQKALEMFKARIVDVRA